MGMPEFKSGGTPMDDVLNASALRENGRFESLNNFFDGLAHLETASESSAKTAAYAVHIGTYLAGMLSVLQSTLINSIYKDNNQRVSTGFAAVTLFISVTVLIVDFSFKKDSEKKQKEVKRLVNYVNFASTKRDFIWGSRGAAAMAAGSGAISTVPPGPLAAGVGGSKTRRMLGCC